MLSKVPALRKEAALWLLFLGPLFFGVYGFTNWYSATLPEVGHYYLAWERNIPVIPAMIIPYMSIDILFAISLFICTSRKELHTHVKRIVFAILISAACFLLVPLQFAFERPNIDGFYGAIFDLLHGFDKPFNQAPSLHISLLMFLWVVYATHTKGWVRWLVHLWHLLIGLSVLFTYQHHFIDIPTGMLVGMLGFYLFPSGEVERIRTNFHHKFVILYATLALICLIVATMSPSMLVLLWPAAACGIIAAAYAGLGASVFQKQNGRHSMASCLLLAPYRAGAHVSYLLYTRNDPPWRTIKPNLLVGRKQTSQEAEQLVEAGVSAVLDMAPEFEAAASFCEIAYLSLPVLDLTPPTIAQLQRAVDFIKAHEPHGKVYVHCALGYSRSVCAVIAYLLYEKHYSDLASAIEAVHKVHPKLVLNEQYRTLLEAYARSL